MTDPLPQPPPDLLGYAGQGASLPSQPATAPTWCLWLLAALLALEATTAARIEWLNHQAGGVLPNRELRDDGTDTKWRVGAWTTEALWIRLFAPKDDRGRPLPLSDSDKARMQREVAQAKADNHLRDVVSTWGLAQYALVPITLAISLFVWSRSRDKRSLRASAIAGLLISLTAGILACSRAYFTSLGW